MLRRRFIIRGGQLIVALPVGVALAGCEMHDEPQRCEETIADNHGHTLEVPVADVLAGEARSYTLTGVDHFHTVTISVDDMDRLAEGRRLTLRSSSDASDMFGPHSHEVTVLCT